VREKKTRACSPVATHTQSHEPAKPATLAKKKNTRQWRKHVLYRFACSTHTNARCTCRCHACKRPQPRCSTCHLRWLQSHPPSLMPPPLPATDPFSFNFAFFYYCWGPTWDPGVFPSLIRCFPCSSRSCPTVNILSHSKLRGGRCWVQPIADRMALNLEIISKNIQFSTNHTRICRGFIIYYLVLIVNPLGSIMFRWNGFPNNLQIQYHPICNRL